MAADHLFQKEYWDVDYVSGPLIFLKHGGRFATGAMLELTIASGERRQGQVLEEQLAAARPGRFPG